MFLKPFGSAISLLSLWCTLFSVPLFAAPTGAGIAPASGAVVAADSSEQIADRIVNSKIPVLVDFWAAWCGPCKLLNPVIKTLEQKYRGRVLFVKVDVDRHVSLARYFQVSGIPAVFIVKNKAVVDMLQGYRPSEAYEAALNSALAPPPANTSAKPSLKN